MGSVDHVKQFVVEYLQPGSCALDVGANKGRYTETMLEMVGKSGTVHAFEPVAEPVEFLARRCDASNTPNLHIHRIAVSDKAGIRNFYTDIRERTGNVASSLHVLPNLHAENQIRPERVSTVDLDTFCDNNGIRPDLIKIDVEGHEVDVFRGAVRTIERSRPAIVFECWPSRWAKGVRRICAYLQGNYRLRRLQDGTGVEEIDFENERVNSFDIGCVPVADREGVPMDARPLFD